MYAVYTDDLIGMEETEESALAEARSATGLESNSDWMTAPVTPRLATAIEDHGGSSVRYELTADDQLRPGRLDRCLTESDPSRVPLLHK